MVVHLQGIGAAAAGSTDEQGTLYGWLDFVKLTDRTRSPSVGQRNGFRNAPKVRANILTWYHLDTIFT
jgi:hypothetical protein